MAFSLMFDLFETIYLEKKNDGDAQNELCCLTRRNC